MDCPVFDVVVVGSGFGGSVAALRLAEKGYRVLVLEQGRRWRSKDFPRWNWNLRRAFWFPALGCHGIWGLKLLRDVLVLHGVGVGGGSLVYANTLMEPPRAVWDDPAWGPLRHRARDIVAHYPTVLRMLGAATNPRLGAADDALRAAAVRRGRERTFAPTRVGVFFGEPGIEVPDPYFQGHGPSRVGCTFCGGCMTGCRVGAKNTLDLNYLYLAERLGAQVWAEAQVDGIQPAPHGGYWVTWRRPGSFTQPHRVACERVILAAGVLGTVRLLLQCRHRNLLPGLSPRLGFHVRTNNEALLGVTSRSRRDLWQGVAIGSAVQMDGETVMEPVRFAPGNDVLLLLGTLLTDGGPGWPRWWRWLGQVARHPWQFLRVTKPWGKAASSVVLLAMQTQPSETRLILKRSLWRLGRSTLASQAVEGAPRVPSFVPLANQVAREMAKELDAIPQNALNEVLLDIPTTAHILGGCAPGFGPDGGVVDANFEVFGHPGLYVMDGSVVGANLGVNPSLTIAALAEYAISLWPSRRP
ncbi:MAG: FAD-dependent oxidoreductase [Thermoanaerobaculum sp.]|nr:FAD-dependent oxidoreductase [Thermoanaerobaculum sp.]MDW7968317.1 FAD-dependent oxidoreductase [Thermoanaerobaculum sp.]